MESVYQALSALEAKGGAGVLCIIIDSQGSTPRGTGSKMLVYPDGSFVGTVGGGELESRVISEALGALTEGKARKIDYSMTDPQRGDPGVCGGQLEVFVEPIVPSPLLVVIGGGHVGKAVAHLAKWLGFRVAVSDDRPEFCTAEAIPEADDFYAVPMADLPEHLEITPWTYTVLTTRGALIDAAGLPNILKSESAYIGVIGSRRRWATTVGLLKEAGVSDEELGRVHSPTGLELNAETPEEIAVSILAEIIMLRGGGDGTQMSGV
ncbi:MAG: XdhC family protein [Chloroflexi bacterium]|nr:XdhC family protein [Chloroflexota bacterium]